MQQRLVSLPCGQLAGKLPCASSRLFPSLGLDWGDRRMHCEPSHIGSQDNIIFCLIHITPISNGVQWLAFLFCSYFSPSLDWLYGKHFVAGGWSMPRLVRCWVEESPLSWL